MNKTPFFIKNGTIIGIPMSFNWDTMSITLKKCLISHTNISKNTTPCFDIKHNDHHSSIEQLSLLEPLP